MMATEGAASTLPRFVLTAECQRMNPMRIIGFALIVVGAIVLYFGYNASQSVTEQLTESLTGRFSDDTMLYFLGGAIAIVTGLVFIVRK